MTKNRWNIFAKYILIRASGGEIQSASFQRPSSAAILMSVLISNDCERAEKQHRAVRWGRRGDPVGGFLTRLAPSCSSALFNATSVQWSGVTLISAGCKKKDPLFSSLFFYNPLFPSLFLYILSILCITSEGASRAMPGATRDVTS